MVFQPKTKKNMEQDGFQPKTPKNTWKKMVFQPKPKKHMQKLVFQPKTKKNKWKTIVWDQKTKNTHCKTKNPTLLSQPHSFGFVVFFGVFVLFTRIRDLIDFGDLSCFS